MARRKASTEKQLETSAALRKRAALPLRMCRHWSTSSAFTRLNWNCKMKSSAELSRKPKKAGINITISMKGRPRRTLPWIDNYGSNK